MKSINVPVNSDQQPVRSDAGVGIVAELIGIAEQFIGPEEDPLTGVTSPEDHSPKH